MKKFRVEFGYDVDDVICVKEYVANDVLDLIKQVREFDECYDDDKLIEWLGDEKGNGVDDEFLLDLVSDEYDGKFWLMLAEMVYVECCEVK